MAKKRKIPEPTAPSLAEIKSIVERTLIYKKFLSYINALIEKPFFQKKIREIRLNHGLPTGGVRINKKDPKKDAKYRDLYGKLNLKDLESEVKKLTGKYAIHDWSPLLRHYVIFNNFNLKTNFPFLTLEISDLRYIASGPYKSTGDKDIAAQYLEEIAETHPIALLINPYASQNEIVDYVKKLYKKVIKYYQEKYKDQRIKLGKNRKRNTRIIERSQFIYDNRYLSIKDLTSKVNGQYKENLEYSYINKILTNELKKRGEHR